MKISFDRRVATRAVDCVLSVSEYKSMDEILAVLNLARQHGYLSAKLINEELLFVDGESSYGRNFIKAVEAYDLIEHLSGDRYKLTEMGEASVKEGKALVPSRGNYTIFISMDSLLKDRVLEIRESKERKGNQPEEMNIETKRVLEKQSGKEISLIAGKGRRVSITDIGDYMIESGETLNSHISLNVELGKPPEFVVATDKDVSKPETLEGFESFSILRAITEKYGELSEEGVLSVRYEDIAGQKSILDFSMDLNLQHPVIENRGEFEPTTLKNIPIRPLSIDDAVQWATDIALNDVKDHVDRSEFERIRANACEKFSKWHRVESLILKVPGYDEVVKMAREGVIESTEKKWFLLAKSDLSMEGIANGF